MITPAIVREWAVAYLARREHSAVELARKLLVKARRIIARLDDADAFDPACLPGMIEDIILDLQARGMLSNDRFAESFIRARAARGYGPSRIRAELAERGLDREAVSHAFQQSPIDWPDLKKQTLEKKFGEETSSSSLSDRAKQQAWLYRKGWSGV